MKVNIATYRSSAQLRNKLFTSQSVECTQSTMGLWQSGHPLSISVTVSAQLPENQEWPQGTTTTPERGATRHTSHVHVHALQRRRLTTARQRRHRRLQMWATWIHSVERQRRSAASSVSSLSLESKAHWNASPCVLRDCGTWHGATAAVRTPGL